MDQPAKQLALFHTSLILLLILFADASPASGLFGNSGDTQEFLSVDEAFQLTATADSPQQIRLFWNITEGYYLYRQRISIAAENSGMQTGQTQIGQYQLPAGKQKYDEFFGDVEIYQHNLEVAVPVSTTNANVTLLVGYQGCATAGLCYPPVTKSITLSLPARSAGASAASFAAASIAGDSIDANQAGVPANARDTALDDLEAAHPLYAILLSLGFGILVAFTACMYPMIPILTALIMGQSEKITAFKAFTLSLSYTQGIALTFGVLGAVFAIIGQALGIQGSLQTPWILIPCALLFVGLALSMFGFYDIQLPAGLQTRLSARSSRQPGGSVAGAGLMGVLSALIVGPCGGPVLLAMLAFAAQAQSPLHGFMYLWVFGTGMGLPLLIMGAGGGALLPKTGAWMERIKAAAGVIMLALAVSFLERLSPTYIPATLIMLMWGSLLIVISVYLGALTPLPENAGGWNKLWKGAGVVLLIYGALFLTGIATGGKDTFRPLSAISSFGYSVHSPQHVPVKRIKSIQDLNQKIAAARSMGKPVMLDFYADWCAYCKTMEKKVFPDPRVVAALQGVVFLQADITVQDDTDKALAKHLNMPAPPALYFWNADGVELRAGRLVGNISAEQLASHLNKLFGS